MSGACMERQVCRFWILETDACEKHSQKTKVATGNVNCKLSRLSPGKTVRCEMGKSLKVYKENGYL